MEVIARAAFAARQAGSATGAGSPMTVRDPGLAVSAVCELTSPAPPASAAMLALHGTMLVVLIPMLPAAHMLMHVPPNP
jgi:hypothetical protein